MKYTATVRFESGFTIKYKYGYRDWSYGNCWLYDKKDQESRKLIVIIPHNALIEFDGAEIIEELPPPVMQ